jgi:tripartite-type tricarboxylate transporter receptor subunit TctC
MYGKTSVLALALGALIVTPAASDEVADFYKDRTVSIVVGFTAGGGADTFARLLGRNLAAHIPGNPNVIVQNLPGAGGINAFNQVYNTQPQDGTRTILTSPSHMLSQLMDTPNVRYDMGKMHWLGNLTRDVQSCVASGQSGIKSIKDAAERELIVGATGPNDSIAQHARLLSGLLGYKLRVVSGYPGTSQVRLAMETGEAEVVCAFWASQAMGPQQADMASGKLVPIVQMTATAHEAFGEAPLVYDLARNDEDRMLMRVVFGTTELSRPFLAPPGTPAARVAALRDAFWAAVNSPELKNDAARSRLILNPMGWQDSEAMFREIVGVPRNVVERAKEMTGG